MLRLGFNIAQHLSHTHAHTRAPTHALYRFALALAHYARAPRVSLCTIVTAAAHVGCCARFCAAAAASSMIVCRHLDLAYLSSTRILARLSFFSLCSCLLPFNYLVRRGRLLLCMTTL